MNTSPLLTTFSSSTHTSSSPRCLTLDVLSRLHEGHLGIIKCHALARSSVWRPYVSSNMEEIVNKCSTCAIHCPERKEPLLPSSFTDHPWARLGMDFLELNGRTYLAIVDYYSRWVKVKLLTKQTSTETIHQIKSVFAAHGIQDIIVNDSHSQFSSQDFANFASSYGFTHMTSSSRHPKANGEAERAVQTIKQLLEKSKDLYLALLIYRTTLSRMAFPLVCLLWEES